MNNLLILTKQHEKHIFNGLAHFIKGGIFVGFGIITLGRWIGCFAEFGWAWNLKPSNLAKRTASISMETVECFVIFLYGITNVFLEHLSAWGGAWVPQDLEHVAISLLFIGGGLVGDPGELTGGKFLTHFQCGLMVESKALRRLVKAYPEALPHDGEFSKHLQPQPGISINPIPAMIIFLLGMILGGHHQMSTESTMMHKQVTSRSFPTIPRILADVLSLETFSFPHQQHDVAVIYFFKYPHQPRCTHHVHPRSSSARFASSAGDSCLWRV